MFPSKESRDAWTANYDAEAEQAKMSALIKEKTGFSSEELDEDKEYTFKELLLQLMML